MKIAFPLLDGLLSEHFGHAPEFEFVVIENNKILGSERKIPPPHEPGVLPKWLGTEGATHIICGGIGPMAVKLMREAGIAVYMGFPGRDLQYNIDNFINGNLKEIIQGTCGGHTHTGEHSCGH